MEINYRLGNNAVYRELQVLEYILGESPCKSESLHDFVGQKNEVVLDDLQEYGLIKFMCDGPIDTWFWMLTPKGCDCLKDNAELLRKLHNHLEST